jgi:hypothetical protein
MAASRVEYEYKPFEYKPFEMPRQPPLVRILKDPNTYNVHAYSFVPGADTHNNIGGVAFTELDTDDEEKVKELDSDDEEKVKELDSDDEEKVEELLTKMENDELPYYCMHNGKPHWMYIIDSLGYYVLWVEGVNPYTYGDFDVKTAVDIEVNPRV